MKYLILIFFSWFLVNHVCGQNDSLTFFNEFTISINQTNVKDYNTENRNGFGLGAYFSLSPEKRISFTFGFEFNQTRQFLKNIYEGHFANSKDITIIFNNISVPLMERLNFGHKTKLFVEAGFFLDISPGSIMKGTRQTYYPDSLNILNFRENNFRD